ncbi:alpha-L-fucosidase [Croceivirga radicis]|uniref:alpha-L-fucosidase n=1 Tax=Croceivirga radicis TaxID=1929488 RepID=UPI000255B106|nr:alpha-L-fucosidase [Croceivirga radicis]
MKKYQFTLFLILLYNFSISQQPIYDIGQNYISISPTDTKADIIEKAAKVAPSQRQYNWQKQEMTAFIHFGVKTYDDNGFYKRETDISLFNPKEIDVKQWVRVLKEAGMKLVVFTAKHSDGLCLWPSKYTDYNITKTPYQNGKGDLVRDMAQACEAAGLKFGVYISPYDMHEPSFGTEAYNILFKNHLTELLTNYGPIHEVWFDGHGDGTKIPYDWEGYYSLIRKLQPEAVIAVMGPDVRWVGTESGYGRHTEWSVLPGNAVNQDDIAANSQQSNVEGAFVPRNLMKEDLGSREILEKATSLVWYPAEIDVSIRPGWFYAQEDDHLVKSPQKLVDIYYNSVGLNGVLLLNIAPDERGLVPEQDVKSLQGMHYLLDRTFDTNLFSNPSITSNNQHKKHKVTTLLDGDNESFWTPKKDLPATVVLSTKNRQRFNTLLLQENIINGQRIENFVVEIKNGSKWDTLTTGTTVGYKRLFRFDEVFTDQVRLTITGSRGIPELSEIGVYNAPPEVIFEKESQSFANNLTVELKSTSSTATIFYTIDGSEPTTESAIYQNPITISENSTIKAIAKSKDNKTGLVQTATYHKANYKVKYNEPFSKKFPGEKELSLVDGKMGILAYNQGNWQGFRTNNVDVVVDLGSNKTIHSLSTRYLKTIQASIFAPEWVSYSFSEDGIHFSEPIILKNTDGDEIDKNEIPTYHGKKSIKTFATEKLNITTRYIRVIAKNRSVCPEWHKNAGKEAWLFIDEVLIN